MEMVQFGEDSSLNEKCLNILAANDSFGAWHLDGDRAIEVIVMSKIDPSEPALTKLTDDPVPPDLRGIAIRRATRTLSGRLGVSRFRQSLGLIHRPTPDDDRSLPKIEAIVSSWAGTEKWAKVTVPSRRWMVRPHRGHIGSRASTLVLGICGMVAAHGYARCKKRATTVLSPV
jgi:hypothetical protein